MRIISVVMLLCMALSLSAQNIVKGKVYDASNHAIEGVNVSVKNAAAGTVSTADGSFSVKTRRGSSVLVFSYLGYETQELKVDAASDAALKVTMQVAPIVYEEFEVSATRAGDKAPFAVNTITAEELEKRNTGSALPELLKLSPSVVTSTEGGMPFGNTKFRIRGSDPSRINVTVDGIPLNDAESQTVFWVNMTDVTESVSDIEIQRGVGASTNGAASFGANVNIQTKGYDANPYAEVSSYAGSFNTFKNSVQVNSGLIKDHFVFNARLSSLSSDGYIKHSGMKNNSYFFSGGYFSDKTTLRVKVFGNEEHTDISWWGIDSSQMKTDRRYNPAGVYSDKDGVEHYYEDQKDNYWQNHAHLHLSHKITDQLQFKSALHYTRGSGYYEQMKDDEDISKYGFAMPFLQVGVDTISTSDIARQKWLENQFYGFTASLEYTTDNLNLIYGMSGNRYDGDHYGKVIWSEYNIGIPVDYRYYSNKSIKDDYATFLKANYNLTPELSAYADVQYRYVDYDMSGTNSDLLALDIQKEYNFFNPKFGAYYDLGQHSVYVSFGVSNREPSRANLKDALENNDETPTSETLFDTEYGYKFESSDFSLQANMYFMNYKDQLVPTGEKNSVGYEMMTNVEESYRAGIELAAAYMPLSWFKWEANATFSQNKIDNYVEHVDDITNELGTTDIAYSPNVVAASLLSFYPVENLTLALNSKYVGEQFFDNTSEDAAKLDAYFVNDFVAAYQMPLDFADYVELKFMVNNVFDANYITDAYGGKYVWDGVHRWSAYFPQAFRNYAVKLVVRF